MQIGVLLPLIDYRVGLSAGSQRGRRGPVHAAALTFAIA